MSPKNQPTPRSTDSKKSETSTSKLSHHAIPGSFLAITLLSGGVFLPSAIAQSASPAPGTVIRNQATGSFVDPGDDLVDPGDDVTNPMVSNVVRVTVAEVAGITVTSNGYREPIDNTVNEGDTVFVDFVITNVGNDPTQFFIPDVAAISGGTANGDIQVIEYDPDGTGTSPVDLSGNDITVPSAGETTGNLVGMPNNGSIPAGGSITVQVPVTAGMAGLDLIVTLGDAAATDGQNEAYVTGSNDVYTVDNTQSENDDTDGAPINGEREAENSVKVVIAEPIKPNVLLVKRITAINRGLTEEQPFDNSYIDVGTPSDNDNEVNWPGGITSATIGGGSVESYLPGITGVDDVTAVAGTTVKPGDEIEYTISFLSSGNITAQNVFICDRIPTNTTFISDAFTDRAPAFTGGGNRGILINFNNTEVALTNANDGDEIAGTSANDGVGGYYFPPGVDPNLTIPDVECDDTNENGVIVVDISNLPHATGEGSPDNSYGFIRFRVVVNNTQAPVPPVPTGKSSGK